jgi:DNA modification methylase
VRLTDRSPNQFPEWQLLYSITDGATIHTLHLGDARNLDWIPDRSVHLVVTSPPYWTLKEYRDHPGQLGAVADDESFMDELDKVWSHCDRVLVPGGRLRRLLVLVAIS